ncbi:M15 family metallopeptidase [Agrococcus sp. ARC_14]|uniref:M15 family metallopeptidase n=1 Tax=Agrococcus sp. ARC_14 TaxID=2919927 RepID=UPI001F058EAA|nr:M15 family metallopeptidase [Agrococcus sp. ARC_14]MCH1882069.1 M15 family metallopeptidase [Agrococcus sp. ARC_14]
MRRTVGLVLGTIAAVAVLSGCAAPEPVPSASPTPTALETPTATPTAQSPSPTPTPTPSTPATAAPPQAAEPPAAGDIESATSLQVLVNKRTPLQPADYLPELVSVSTAQDGDETVRPEVDAALVAMSDAMRVDIGEGIHVFSSYRSYARQTELYNGYVARNGQAVADTTSARPGHSEHQTGLAVDLRGTGGVCELDVCFGDTAAGRWVAEHGWEHGFIVRYPDGLQGITGYHYEPWHIRFVGVEVSTAMHEQGARTYEEYLGSGSAPDYG